MKNKIINNKFLLGATVIFAFMAIYFAFLPTRVSADTIVSIGASSTGGSNDFTDMVITSDGRPVITYANSSTGWRVAKCSDSVCSSISNDTAVSNVSGTGGIQMAIMSNGFPILVFDGTAGLVAYKCSNQSCTAGSATTLLSGTNYGQWPDVVVPSDNNPVISLNNNTGGTTMVYKCSNSTCTSGSSTTIYSASASGANSKITLSSDGLPFVIYGIDNTGLAYTKCGNAACTSGNTNGTIESFGSSSFPVYTSITRGTDGLPFMIYNCASSCTGNAYYLRYTKCTNSTCSTKSQGTIATSAGLPYHFATAMGTDGYPVIVYGWSSSVQVFKCDNANCTSGLSNAVESSTGSTPGAFNPSIAVDSSNLPFVEWTNSKSPSGAKIAHCSQYNCSQNNVPTITSGPSAGYNSYTRTGPSNSYQVIFTATDPEQTGANQLTFYVHTGANRTGNQVCSGTFTSGVGVSSGCAYNAVGMAQGSNTLYLSVYDGIGYSSSNPSFTVLRDDSVTSPSSISTSPATVVGNQYSVTFTSTDTYSTGANEMRFQVRTSSGGGGTLIGSGNYTQGSSRSTGTLTDNSLVNGSNTRYLRVFDGANNVAETSFAFTSTPAPSGVTTNNETNLGSYKVTFNGSANPNGSAAYGYFRVFTGAEGPPDCTVDSGGTRVPSSSSADVSLGSGSSSVPFSFNTPGGVTLTRQTQYWYCAYARNTSAGPSNPGTSSAAGYDTFTTLDGPASGCDAPASGNLTVTETCSFPQSDYDGVDAGGSGTSNSGLITLASGGFVTLNAGQRISRGGIVMSGGGMAIGNGSGAIIKGGLWVKDSDGDGIVDSPLVKTVSQSQPAGYIRRNYMYTLPAYNNSSYNYASKIYNASAGLDCDQTNANIFQTVPNLVVDADNDGYKTSASASSICVGSTSTINGRTYYRNATGGFTYMDAGDALGSGATDCTDSSAAPCPVTVSAGGVTQTSTSVVWTAATGPSPTSYDLYWCSGSSCTPSTLISSVSSTYSHTGRTCNTTYGYRIIAKNASGSSSNSNTNYQTTSSCATAPTVQTSAASNVAITTATFNSIVNPNGDNTNIYYRYGTSNVSCSSLPFTTSSAGAAGGNSNVSPNALGVSSLSPKTTYYYCAYATNSIGTTYGGVITFTTLGPTVQTTSASNIQVTTATIGGNYGAYAGATLGVWFRYWSSDPGSCSDSGGTRSPSSGNSNSTSSTGPFGATRNLTGLTGGATYYYCILGSDTNGSYTGQLQSFTTGLCGRDADGDTYGVSTQTAACGTSGYVSNYNDCYDSNSNAKPGQTSYFTVNRGDGSYDYNCDSSTTVQSSNNAGASFCAGNNYWAKPATLCAYQGTLPINAYCGVTTASCGSTYNVVGSSNTGFYSDSGCTSSLTYYTSGSQSTQACR